MNYRKKPLEQIPEENTAVWACTSDDCNGWMRDNFAFEAAPSCPLCQSTMEQEVRMLPQLANPTGDAKTQGKSVTTT